MFLLIVECVTKPLMMAFREITFCGIEGLHTESRLVWADCSLLLWHFRKLCKYETPSRGIKIYSNVPKWKYMRVHVKLPWWKTDEICNTWNGTPRLRNVLRYELRKSACSVACCCTYRTWKPCRTCEKYIACCSHKQRKNWTIIIIFLYIKGFFF